MKCWSEHIIFLENKPESYTVRIKVAFHDWDDWECGRGVVVLKDYFKMHFVSKNRTSFNVPLCLSPLMDTLNMANKMVQPQKIDYYLIWVNLLNTAIMTKLASSISGATTTEREVSEPGTRVTGWRAMPSYALFIPVSRPVPWPLWGRLCRGANMPHWNVSWIW
jgi:hypothetical protein